MWLALLAGCGCPRFAETAVNDTTGGGAPAVVETVEAALADFAAWTGREGVCVPSIDIVDNVNALHADSVARYFGRGRSIGVEVGGPTPYRSTLHELCHALDYLEGHSADNAALFADEPVPEAYAEDARGAEAFARACSDGPPDWDITRHLADACGGEPDPAARYLATEVYRATHTVSAEPVDVAIVTSTSLHIDAGDYVYDGVEVDGGVLLLADWYDLEADTYRVGILHLDGTGAVTRRVALDVSLPGGARGFFVSPGLVVLYDLGVSPARTALFAVDATTGVTTPIDLPDLPDFPQRGVVSEGVVYIDGDDTVACADPASTATCASRRLAAWTLDTWEPLSLGAAPYGRSWARVSLQAVTGGVEITSPGTLDRFDRATTTWTSMPLPEGAWPIGALSADLRQVMIPRGLWWDAATLDVTTGAWHVATDPCTSPIFGGEAIFLDLDGGVGVLVGWAVTGGVEPVLHTLAME